MQIVCRLLLLLTCIAGAGVTLGLVSSTGIHPSATRNALLSRSAAIPLETMRVQTLARFDRLDKTYRAILANPSAPAPAKRLAASNLRYDEICRKGTLRPNQNMTFVDILSGAFH